MGRAKEGSGATRLLLKDDWHRGALVVDAPATDVERLVGAQHFSFTESHVARECGTAPPPAERWLVYLPKGNARRDYVAALATKRTEVLQFVGPAKGGIKSAKKALQRAFADVRTLAIGHHHQLIEGREPAGHVEAPFEKRWSTGLGFDAFSLPGTFSAGRLDEGTRLFVDALRAVQWSGRAVLDLACGSGVLGLWLAAQGARVTMSDSDHLACEATRMGVARFEEEHGPTGAKVLPSWAYARIEGAFDAIVTNPPFHEGSATSYAAAESFVRDAPKHLRPGGELWLVANHFLPYEGWLEDTFGAYESRYEGKRFKVLRAKRHA